MECYPRIVESFYRLYTFYTLKRFLFVSIFLLRCACICVATLYIFGYVGPRRKQWGEYRYFPDIYIRLSSSLQLHISAVEIYIHTLFLGLRTCHSTLPLKLTNKNITETNKQTNKQTNVHYDTVYLFQNIMTIKSKLFQTKFSQGFLFSNSKGIFSFVH